VQVRARDAAGNESTFISRQFTVVDETAPTVSVTSPLPGTRYNFGETIPLVVQASDAVGVTEVRYQLEGSFTGTDSQTLTPQPGVRTVLFDIPVVPAATEGDLDVRVFSKDAAGNEREATTLVLEITNEDITPPETEATATSDTGSGTLTTVTYEVIDGLDDLSHVELYFRRNGIGTFNRYTDPENGNQEGHFTPQNGVEGTIVFDATKMGGDGSFELYTVGVDTSGNRESAPVNESDEVFADQTRAIASGMEFVVIDEDLVIESSDTTYDDKNVRLDGATVTLKGHHLFRNMELLNGAVLTHAPTTVDVEEGLSFEVWSLSIDGSSRIDVSGKGYLGGLRGGNPDVKGRTLGNAPGSDEGAGGSYGGRGGALTGANPAPVYGNLTNPVELGTGGGSRFSVMGGNGGGKVLISAINIASDGRIQADGAIGGGSFSGSGAGGAVKIITRTMSGSGEINALGGAHQVGGGGGRIAVFYLDIDTKDTSLIKALGGVGSSHKGANGTVFLKSSSDDNGSLIVDGEVGVETFTSLPIPPGFVFDDITLRNNARVIVNGTLEVKNTLSLLDNSILTHDQGVEEGLRIIASEVFVDSSSAINVSGKGYSGGTGPANDPAFCRGKTLGNLVGATTDSAASYGGTASGFGGKTNPVYGSHDNPVYPGSGGPCRFGISGGNGGGVVIIDASDRIRIDGVIRANGALGSGSFSGSGSGGSVKLITSFIRGSGTIESNGGGGQVPAGGGRVAIFYDFLGGDGENFANLMNVTAFAGVGGAYPASPGTVFVKRSDQSFGDLYVDNNTSVSPATHLTPLTPIGFGSVQNVTEDTIELNGTFEVLPDSLVGLEINPNVDQDVRYRVTSNSTHTLTVDITGKPALTSLTLPGDSYIGEYRFDNVFMRRGGGLLLSDKLVVSQKLSMQEHARISHYQVRPGFESFIDIAAPRMEIDSTSEIFVDGKGYLGGNQNDNPFCEGMTLPGLNAPTTGSGGSYAGLARGFGGETNPVYGSLELPVDFGTGGPCRFGIKGGNGGGKIYLSSSSVLLDGIISSNGLSGLGSSAGSGSGGSILIQTSDISGAGLIRSNGGGYQVGGSGGRVALYYSGDLIFPRNRIEARGGIPSNVNYSGGNGAVFLKSNSDSGGEIILDGYGQNTPLDSTVFPETVGEISRLTLRNNARVITDRAINVAGTMELLNGSRLSHPLQHESGVEITANNLLIDETSSIDVSAKGYRGGNTEGHSECAALTLGAQSTSLLDIGGSYGGLGGNSVSGAVSFNTYGNPSEAFYLGTGGSCKFGVSGGHGGGLIRLTINENLEVNGSLWANGQAGSGSNAGSGSGGSIHVVAEAIKGSGFISADGGSYQIGGGGGRVALYFNTFGDGGADFNEGLQITAAGGNGSTANGKGSAGTVFMKPSALDHGTLIIDQVSDFLSQRETPLTRVGFGEIQELTENQLTTDGGVLYTPGALVGLKIKPDIESDEVFIIVANSEDIITVDISSGTDLIDVAAVGDTYSGWYEYDQLIIRRGGYLELSDIINVIDDVSLLDLSMLTHARTTDLFFPYLDLRVGGTLTVAPDATIDVSERGYLGGNRPGNPVCAGRTFGNVEGSKGTTNSHSAGGSYGGIGAVFSASGIPNTVYGIASSPMERGSGGSCRFGTAGGNGGGFIKINSADVQLDGSILANGQIGAGSFAGSGSGGGINISVSTISGSGIIQANGGGYQLGGGGGRIAITAGTNTLNANNIEAKGGTGDSGSGEDGTVHLVP
jgi:large repetitive protein